MARPSRIFFRRSLNEPITIALSSALEATAAGDLLVETAEAEVLDGSGFCLGDEVGELVDTGGRLGSISISGMLLESVQKICAGHTCLFISCNTTCSNFCPFASGHTHGSSYLGSILLLCIQTCPMDMYSSNRLCA